MLRLKQKTPVAETWSKPDGMPELLYRLLLLRGIKSVDESRRFLTPAKQPLNPPDLFPNLSKACVEIKTEIQSGTRICVYGDYDADGVCASVILYDALRKLGANVIVYIPSRQNEGYGMNEEALRKLKAEGTGLIITVDCGISEKTNIEYAQKLGMKVIVSDHHRGDISSIPDCLIVAAQMGEYPDPYLCGAGVAYKIACGLYPEAENDYIDIAAIATVADIVPMRGENRTITARGIEKIRKSPRVGIKAILDTATVNNENCDEATIGFQIAPRINAAGRLRDAMKAFDLLNARDENEARAIALEIEGFNNERRSQEDTIVKEAHEMLRGYDFTNRRAITLYSDKWNPGVIGIAASKLLEEYHYPVLLFALSEGVLRGSCRSIEGIDIYETLKACSEHLIKFGGHKAAAGLSLKEEEFVFFTNTLDEYLRNNIASEVYLPTVEYETSADISDFNAECAKLINRLRPFGPQNEFPVLLSEFKATNVKRIGKDERHLKLYVTNGDGDYCEAVWFGHGTDAEIFGEKPVKACGQMLLNANNGTERAQFRIDSLIPYEGLAAFDDIPDKAILPSFLTDLLYTDRKSGSARIISTYMAENILRDNLQGVALVFTSKETALDFARRLDPEIVPDVVYGKWSTDDKAFTSITVCPRGDMPAGLHTVISFDVDAMILPDIRPGTELINISDPGEAPEWKRELPDIDTMRAVYRVLRSICSRPLYAKSSDAYYHETACECGISESSAVAAIAVLSHMELIRIIEDEHKMIFLPVSGKADINNDGVFKRICELKCGEA